MTKTLTERWREGTLEDGLYYCKSIYDIEELYLDGRYFWYPLQQEGEPVDVQEVLAPVPSYDHFSQLVKKVEQLQEQLAIATKALKEYANSDDYNYVGTTESGVYWTNNKWIYPWRLAHKALKEMEGVK